MNVEQLKKVIVDICQVLNAISKFVSKQGLLSLYGAIAPVQDLIAIDWVKVKAEILNLDQKEQEELKDVLKGNLALQKPDVQAKLLAAVDCLDQVVDLVQEGVVVFNHGKDVLGKIKQLVGA